MVSKWRKNALTKLNSKNRETSVNWYRIIWKKAKKKQKHKTVKIWKKPQKSKEANRKRRRDQSKTTDSSAKIKKNKEKKLSYSRQRVVVPMPPVIWLSLVVYVGLCITIGCFNWNVSVILSHEIRKWQKKCRKNFTLIP